MSKRLGHSTISVTSDLYGTYSHPPAMRIPMLPKPSVRPIPPCRRDQCAHTAPGRLRWRRYEQGPHTAFPLLRGLSSVSTQSAPGGIRTPNLLIRNQMLYPLSYGRSVASGIPRVQRCERLPVDPAQTEIRARRPAISHNGWSAQGSNSAIETVCLQGWALGAQPLDIGHGFAQPAQPLVAVLPDQAHAPGQRFGAGTGHP